MDRLAVLTLFPDGYYKYVSTDYKDDCCQEYYHYGTYSLNQDGTLIFNTYPEYNYRNEVYEYKDSIKNKVVFSISKKEFRNNQNEYVRVLSSVPEGVDKMNTFCKLVYRSSDQLNVNMTYIDLKNSNSEIFFEVDNEFYDSSEKYIELIHGQPTKDSIHIYSTYRYDILDMEANRFLLDINRICTLDYRSLNYFRVMTS